MKAKEKPKATDHKETKKEAKSERRPKEPPVVREKEQLVEASNDDAASGQWSNGEWSNGPVVGEELPAERSLVSEPLVDQRSPDKSEEELANATDQPPPQQQNTNASEQVKQANAPVKSNGVKQIKQTKIVEIKVKRAAASKGSQASQPAVAQRKQPLKSPQRANEKEEKKSSIRQSRADKGDNKQRLSAVETKKRSLSHSPARPTDQLRNAERQAGKPAGSRAPNKPPPAVNSKNGPTMNKTLAKSVTGLNELKANAKPIKKAAAVRK